MRVNPVPITPLDTLIWFNFKNCLAFQSQSLVLRGIKNLTKYIQSAFPLIVFLFGSVSALWYLSGVWLVSGSLLQTAGVFRIGNGTAPLAPPEITEISLLPYFWSSKELSEHRSTELNTSGLSTNCLIHTYFPSNPVFPVLNTYPRI